MKKYIFVILIILMCATPVLAESVYPQGYYDLGRQYDDLYAKFQAPFSTMLSKETVMSALELRRQTILMEKQNELQAELVKAQWVETCYAPKYTGAGNYSAWKFECANAGYPVG